MNPVSTQLEMSAASIRLAGYVIESNLRVAQIIGKAALNSNPFAVPADMRKHVTAAKKSSGTETQKTETDNVTNKVATKKKPAKKAANTASKTKSTAKTIKVKSVASEPVKKPKPAKSTSHKSTQTTKSGGKKTVAPAIAEAKVALKSDAKKSATQPVTIKPKVKTPEFKSRVTRPATPTQAATAKVAAPTAPVAKTADAKVATAQTQPEKSTTADKNHREPSMPAALPAREKVSTKD